MKPIVESINAFYSNLGEQESFLGSISLDEKSIIKLSKNESVNVTKGVLDVLEEHTSSIEESLNMIFDGELIKLINVDRCLEKEFTSYGFVHDIEGLSENISNCVQMSDALETKPIGILDKIYKLQDILISLPIEVDELRRSLYRMKFAFSTVSDPAMYGKLKTMLDQIEGFVYQMTSDLNFFSMVSI